MRDAGTCRTDGYIESICTAIDLLVLRVRLDSSIHIFRAETEIAVSYETLMDIHSHVLIAVSLYRQLPHRQTKRGSPSTLPSEITSLMPAPNLKLQLSPFA